MHVRHLLLLVSLLASCTVWADTFRCGSALVSQGDPSSEVLRKCGEPADRAVIGFKEMPDDWGFWHEVRIEEWTYGPSHGMYHVLRFEGNRLADVDSYRGS